MAYNTPYFQNIRNDRTNCYFGVSLLQPAWKPPFIIKKRRNFFAFTNLGKPWSGDIHTPVLHTMVRFRIKKGICTDPTVLDREYCRFLNDYNLRSIPIRSGLTPWAVGWSVCISSKHDIGKISKDNQISLQDLLFLRRLKICTKPKNILLFKRQYAY